jgi:hypothetical protein
LVDFSLLLVTLIYHFDLLAKLCFCWQYHDPNYNGGSIGEYQYYDWSSDKWDQSTCKTGRCAKMDCHASDTEWELIGVYKASAEFDRDTYFEQLFKHEGTSFLQHFLPGCQLLLCSILLNNLHVSLSPRVFGPMTLCRILPVGRRQDQLVVIVVIIFVVIVIFVPERLQLYAEHARGNARWLHRAVERQVVQRQKLLRGRQAIVRRYVQTQGCRGMDGTPLIFFAVFVFFPPPQAP